MKATMKNVVIDDNNEELVAFAQTIDFAELFDHVRDFVNVECSFYPPEITTNDGEVSINFMSDDITSRTGVFAAVLERCCIRSFMNGIHRDKKTGTLGYWVCVSIRYEHKDGGGCGLDVVHAAYSGGKWEFRNAGQKREKTEEGSL